MNDDFRQRVFLPIMLPLGVIVGFFGFAFMLSRVLLAVSATASTFIALGLAAYILAIAAVVSAKPRITSRALAVGVSLGIVGVVAAGGLAATVGMRDLEHHAAAEDQEAEHDSDNETTAGATEEAADTEDAEDTEEAGASEDELEWVAVDLDFTEAPESTSAGTKQIVLTNDGQAPHNVTIPELNDAPVVEAAPGETATGDIELEPGTYEYFCSVPGHESLMNGELTVE